MAPAPGGPVNIPQVDVGAIGGGCIRCGQSGLTRQVTFHQNVGALVVRFTKTLQGPACASCINSTFWQFTLVTLFFGWWGLISFIVTPIFLIGNLVSYGRATGRWGVVAGFFALLAAIVAGIVILIAGSHPSRGRRASLPQAVAATSGSSTAPAGLSSLGPRGDRSL